MKFKDAIRQGLEQKTTKRRKADATERAAARLKGGKLQQRRRIEEPEAEPCTRPTIGKPAHCGDPGCFDHEGWN